jgi:hypothetical protein
MLAGQDGDEVIERGGSKDGTRVGDAERDKAAKRGMDIGDVGALGDNTGGDTGCKEGKDEIELVVRAYGIDKGPYSPYQQAKRDRDGGDAHQRTEAKAANRRLGIE